MSKLNKIFVCFIVLILTVLLNIPTVTMAAELSPDQDQPVKQLETIFNQVIEATQVGDFSKADEGLSKMLEIAPDNPAIWSERGNVRVGQNRIEEAIADYQQAIKLAPNAPEPYLNRGVAYERLEKWSEAIADYDHVLAIDLNDPIAYNNRGNAKAGLGEWEGAIADFAEAFKLEPKYSFARANHALALYEFGKKEQAIQEMKSLVRKYPNFADMRAALTAVLWVNGKQGEAESNWVAAVGLDNRYQDIDWVKNIRRWPNSVTIALQSFLELK
ncbi:MAG: tetratricopeptide repeat protein [Microcoleaceae cyanobacterium]